MALHRDQGFRRPGDRTTPTCAPYVEVVGPRLRDQFPAATTVAARRLHPKLERTLGQTAPFNACPSSKTTTFGVPPRRIEKRMRDRHRPLPGSARLRHVVG